MAELAVRSVLLSEIQSVLSIARRRYGYSLVHQNGKTAQVPVSRSRTVENRPLYPDIFLGFLVQDEPQGGIFHSFALLRARLLRSESECLLFVISPVVSSLTINGGVMVVVDLTELNPSSVLRPFLDLVRHEHTSSTLTGAALEAVQHFLQCWDWDVNQASLPDMLADVVDAVSQCRFQETNAESDQHVLVLVVLVLQAVLLCPAASKLSDHAMWQLVEALYALSRANRNDPHITLSLRASATSVLNRAIEFVFQSPAVYADPPTVSSSSCSAMDSSFGLPCAVKILGFLCQKLHPRGSSLGSSAGGGGSSLVQLPTRREVLLSFTLLQRMLVACDAQHFSQIPSLMLFIKDDLCGAILRYGRLGASSDLKIPVLCLGIIRLLWTKLRPLLKMQLEALFNGVFCHTLHWCVAHLDLAHPIFPNNLETTTQADQSGASTAFAYVDAVREEFTGEIVPLNKLFSISFEILDCLVDLLAEPTLLPDLYVNYDCDSNRADLTHTLFELLALVVTKTHHACQETSDEVHFLWAQATGELALRGMFNALYVVYARTKQTSASAPSSQNGIIAHDSAEALHLKRQRKKVFQHGIVEFNRKPLSGIKLLQQNAFLPTPLDAKSLAAFLRSLPPGLRKVTVGVYLGAMGKEVKDFEKSDIHEADTTEFHRDVLENFVRSFNFESESIVAALRMFLASFRLPGEAQQIDRILNTFSMQVYEQCRDRFVMASPDVAYLLSFSLIMLNTDLHNPNIRPEKKMKLEDFIKNNRNYGEEVSKKQDLPDDFLTELYDAIAKEEIKTREDDSKHGEVTTDRWKDLLYQAESDPQGSRFITHQSPYKSPLTGSQNGTAASPRRRRSDQRSTKSTRRRSTSRSGSVVSTDDELVHCGKGSELHTNGSMLLDNDEGGTGHQYDRDIFGMMQDRLKLAFSSVFQQFVDVAHGPHGGLMDESPASTSDGRNSVPPDDIYLPDKGMLQLACNGFVLCAATAASHGFVDDSNELFVAVAKFSGLYASELYPSAYNGRANGVALFCHNQSAPVATAAMLKIVSACGKSIQKESWQHFFHAIATLREFGALPERLLHGAAGSHDALLTGDESEELLELVRANREELERREAMRLKELDRTNSSSSFFSGMAWLMSALDTTNVNGFAPSTPSPSGSRGFQSASATGQVPEIVVRTPQELAADARDLIVKQDIKPVKRAAQVDFGTSEWIVQSLQPYRVDHLVDELCVLPTAALCEIVKALSDEIVQALTGSPKSAASSSSKRRVSTFPGAGSSSLAVNQTEEAVTSASPGSRLLSPAGCVLFEHLLVRLLSALPRDTILDHMDGLWEALEAHYLKLPSLVRPILLKNTLVNGIGYDSAALTLAKALEGLLTLVLKTRNEKSLCLLMSVLTALVDMSAADDDELLKPYLTLIFSGLKRVADSVDLRGVRFDHGEWLTVSNLMGWAVEQPTASIHAFAFLEKLLASEVWRADVETTFSLMELYTKALLFALQKDNVDASHHRWPCKRPMELMCWLFERLQTSDPEVEEEERLRQLGGMTLVCRHALRSGSSTSSSAEPLIQVVNDRAISALEFLRSMIIATPSRESLTGSAWLEVLSAGLLVVGAEILNRKPRFQQDASRPRLGSEDSAGPTGPFLFYERNVPRSLALPPAAGVREPLVKDKSPTAGGQRRGRRPSIVKDPLALRPHLLIVEMISWVACEQLDQLLLLPRFAAVWDELLDQLLAFVELTEPGHRSGVASSQPNHNEEVLAALERRSIMSAHEEIVEHVKSLIRRLTVLQKAHETKKNAGGDALAGARFHALMHVLVEKCQSKGAAFYDQLFVSQEDGASSSTGELTPPLAAANEEDEEEKDDSTEEVPQVHEDIMEEQDDDTMVALGATMPEAVEAPTCDEEDEVVSVSVEGQGEEM